MTDFSSLPLGWISLASIFLATLRVYFILPHRSGHPVKHRKRRSDTCSLAIFLGSGGHTSEALALISTLDFTRYSPRTYLVGEGDMLSAQKAIALEASKAPQSLSDGGAQYSIVVIPRARQVHQSFLTTGFTALWSVVTCVYHTTFAPLFLGKPQLAEVLILNGPGTCFVLCSAIYLNRLLGLPSPKLVFVESFARVRSLSLSGKLLRPFVDRFIVQWPDLVNDNRRDECWGWLV